jgi:hypothetical protein
VFSNADCEILEFRGETEINFKQQIKTFATFDPEVFLIDNPQKLNEVIDSVKERIDNEFNIFKKYETTIESFSKEQTVNF